LNGKCEIRKAMRAARRKVSLSARDAASAEVCATLLARADVGAAMSAKRPFAVYLASPGELDLSALIGRLWAAKCPVLVPAWRDGVYALERYTRDSELVPGPMGILEPSSNDASTMRPSIDPAVWIVPGLAFTRGGMRLGYGGGWYDRLLSAALPGAVKLGVAYPFQVVDDLPCEAHDIPLTDVVVAGGVT
jgi:5-formyltetrahydrofolate cyclo-ligase